MATEEQQPEPSPDAFEVHRQMVLSLFLATMLLCSVLAIGLLFRKLTALMVVAVAGALGGFVSGLRRVYTFQKVFPRAFFHRWHRVNLYVLVYSMIPSLVGSIAAVALYLLFASKLIEGSLFPNFEWSPTSSDSDPFFHFVYDWHPVAAPDYAKAIVWGFIAGFSERFVPGLIMGLTNTETSSAQ